MRMTSLLGCGSVLFVCIPAACGGVPADDEEIVSLESDVKSADETMSAELTFQSQWQGGNYAVAFEMPVP